MSVSGSPDSGTGAILLIDDEARQDIRITCDVTLSAGCENAGIVLGYVDNQNYWVRVYSDTSDTARNYQISSGTWVERGSKAKTITTGTQFSMDVQVRAGQAAGYAATVPAGRVGLWCSDGSANSFDDFVVRDIAGPFDVSVEWYSTMGDVQIDESNDNVLTLRPKNGTGTATSSAVAGSSSESHCGAHRRRQRASAPRTISISPLGSGMIRAWGSRMPKPKRATSPGSPPSWAMPKPFPRKLMSANWSVSFTTST